MAQFQSMQYQWIYFSNALFLICFMCFLVLIEMHAKSLDRLIANPCRSVRLRHAPPVSMRLPRREAVFVCGPAEKSKRIVSGFRQCPSMRRGKISASGRSLPKSGSLELPRARLRPRTRERGGVRSLVDGVCLFGYPLTKRRAGAGEWWLQGIGRLDAQDCMLAHMGVACSVPP